VTLYTRRPTAVGPVVAAARNRIAKRVCVEPVRGVTETCSIGMPLGCAASATAGIPATATTAIQAANLHLISAPSLPAGRLPKAAVPTARALPAAGRPPAPYGAGGPAVYVYGSTANVATLMFGLRLLATADVLVVTASRPDTTIPGAAVGVSCNVTCCVSPGAM